MKIQTEAGSKPIRPVAPTDVDEVVALSLRAWAPVFRSFEAVLGRDIFIQLYPDWQPYQAGSVRSACTEPGFEAWIAEAQSGIAGFVSIKMNQERQEGEIHMVAVDPPHQRVGFGGALTEFALERMRAEGMQRATVGTGGDPGHAPARVMYEKAGFIGLPNVQYYRVI